MAFDVTRSAVLEAT